MTNEREPINLSTYHYLDEDEFEMLVADARVENSEHPGPKMLEQMADILEGQATVLRQMSRLWRAIG